MTKNIDPALQSTTTEEESVSSYLLRKFRKKDTKASEAKELNPSVLDTETPAKTASPKSEEFGILELMIITSAIGILGFGIPAAFYIFSNV